MRCLSGVTQDQEVPKTATIPPLCKKGNRLKGSDPASWS